MRARVVEDLPGEGYEVLEASNAHQTIDVVDRCDRRIDLVFSDVTMPGELDDIGLARWVRVRHPDVAVLLATGYGSHWPNGDLAHEVRLIEKPYTFPQVLSGIRTMLPSVTQTTWHRDTCEVLRPGDGHGVLRMAAG